MIELKDLLGKTRDEFVTRRFMSELAEEPEILEEEDGTYFEFRRRGLSLLFDLGGRLKAIHLYRGGRDGYCEYVGSLPRRNRL